MAEKHINSSTVNIPSITMSQMGANPSPIGGKHQLYITSDLLRMMLPAGTIRTFVYSGMDATLNSLILSTTGGSGHFLKQGSLAGTITSGVISASDVPGISGLCQGRLTLTSGTPITTSDVTGAGTIYFTPFRGNYVSLYNGSLWVNYSLSQISLSLTLTSGNVYDIYLYSDAGNLTLESLVWTNTTTRATAIVLQDGVYVKSGDSTRRYLGTIYASGSNTTEDSETKRFVWNYYNRVSRVMKRLESTDSWTYNSTTWRYANNSASNRLEFVVGVREDEIYALASSAMEVQTNEAGAVGIGLDSNSSVVSDTLRNELYQSGASAVGGTPYAVYSSTIAVGYHYLAWLEQARLGTVSFFGDAGVATIQSGISGRIMN